jgi:hypothetical protein
MKKLTLLFAFALVFFYACNKQESTPTADNQQVESTDNSAYVLNLSDENPVWELVALDELLGNQSNSGFTYLKGNNGNSAHTHGDIAFGPYSLSWSGTENNGGSHGSAILELTWSGGIAQFTLETECVMVDGNEAVYAGIITQILNAPPPPPPPPPCPTFPNCPPPPPNPYTLGNHVTFKVIDNGQGNNAPPDEHCTAIFITGPSLCGIAVPSSGVWNPSNFNQILEVQEPGSVKVNN